MDVPPIPSPATLYWTAPATMDCSGRMVIGSGEYFASTFGIMPSNGYFTIIIIIISEEHFVAQLDVAMPQFNRF